MWWLRQCLTSIAGKQGTLDLVFVQNCVFRKKEKNSQNLSHFEMKTPFKKEPHFENENTFQKRTTFWKWKYLSKKNRISKMKTNTNTLSRGLFTMTLTKHITKEKSQRLFLLDSLFLSQGLGFIQRTPAPSQQAI